MMARLATPSPTCDGAVATLKEFVSSLRGAGLSRDFFRRASVAAVSAQLPLDRVDRVFDALAVTRRAGDSLIVHGRPASIAVACFAHFMASEAAAVDASKSLARVVFDLYSRHGVIHRPGISLCTRNVLRVCAAWGKLEGCEAYGSVQSLEIVVDALTRKVMRDDHNKSIAFHLFEAWFFSAIAGPNSDSINVAAAAAASAPTERVQSSWVASIRVAVVRIGIATAARQLTQLSAERAVEQSAISRVLGVTRSDAAALIGSIGSDGVAAAPTLELGAGLCALCATGCPLTDVRTTLRALLCSEAEALGIAEGDAISLAVAERAVGSMLAATRASDRHVARTLPTPFTLGEIARVTVRKWAAGARVIRIDTVCDAWLCASVLQPPLTVAPTSTVAWAWPSGALGLRTAVDGLEEIASDGVRVSKRTFISAMAVRLGSSIARSVVVRICSTLRDVFDCFEEHPAGSGVASVASLAGALSALIPSTPSERCIVILQYFGEADTGATTLTEAQLVAYFSCTQRAARAAEALRDSAEGNVEDFAAAVVRKLFLAHHPRSAAGLAVVDLCRWFSKLEAVGRAESASPPSARLAQMQPEIDALRNAMQTTGPLALTAGLLRDDAAQQNAHVGVEAIRQHLFAADPRSVVRALSRVIPRCGAAKMRVLEEIFSVFIPAADGSTSSSVDFSIDWIVFGTIALSRAGPHAIASALSTHCVRSHASALRRDGAQMHEGERDSGSMVSCVELEAFLAGALAMELCTNPAVAKGGVETPFAIARAIMRRREAEHGGRSARWFDCVALEKELRCLCLGVSRSSRGAVAAPRKRATPAAASAATATRCSVVALRMAAEACAVEGVDGLLKWLRRFSENSVTMLRRAFVQSFVKLVQPLPQLRKDVTALAGIIADVASHAAQSSSAMKMGIVSKQLPLTTLSLCLATLACEDALSSRDRAQNGASVISALLRNFDASNHGVCSDSELEHMLLCMLLVSNATRAATANTATMRESEVAAVAKAVNKRLRFDLGFVGDGGLRDLAQVERWFMQYLPVNEILV